MKTVLLLLAAIALATPLSATAGDAQEHHHHGPDASVPQLQLNAGKKWESDAALRLGMSAIRTSVVAALPSVHEGTMGSAGYSSLAKDIGSQLGYIFQNCKLDAKADAQLHVVLARLIAGADLIEGKVQGSKPEQGIVQVVEALNVYGNYFDHAGWQPIAHGH